MSRRVRLSAFVLFLPALASAQPTLSVDMGLNSAYMGRGVTTTNRFVIDPMLLVTLPVGATTLALGGLANVEPAHYDGVADLSPLAGLRGPAVTTSQVWVEGRRDVGSTSLAMGAIRYLFPNVGGLADTWASNEVYGIVTVNTVLSPTVGVYYDVEKIRGAYAEAGVAVEHVMPLPRSLSMPLRLAATVGLSAGQAEGGSRDEAAYYVRDGVTHAELSAQSALECGAVVLKPTAHVIVARDEAAQLVAPGQLRRVKGWVGVSLAWARTIGRHDPTPTAP